MRTLILCLISYLTILSHSHAITIGIVGGKEEGGLPIAIVPFNQQPNTKSPSQDIARIIYNDLYRSGRFSPMPTYLLPEKPFQSKQIHFQHWQTIMIPHLVIGRISGGFIGGYTIEFELFDVFKGKRMIGFRYTATAKTLRKVAHQISDEIYNALTGEPSVFNTLIVYVTLQQHGEKIQ